MLQEEENVVNQEETAARQAIAQAQAQQGPPQGGPEQAPGGMPEDPTQAGLAQERLQGGPSAQDIQRREFAENAPQ
jgi:hypothetical protein